MNTIQRKFLISADILRWLETQTFSVQKNEQFYVLSEEGTGMKYFKDFPNDYSEICLDTLGDETRTSVNENVYLEVMKLRSGRKIVKKEFVVVFEHETFVIAQYLKSLEGLFTLSVYANNERTRSKSSQIETLQPFILKEIGKDAKYDEKSLALNVKPMEYDIKKFFEKIDAFESANLFFWQVPHRLYVRDGVALVLYKNLRLLHHYKSHFQKKQLSATLHRLRVLFRRTATMLETFSPLFTPQIRDFAKKLLMRYHEETKRLRYVYFLEDLCATQEMAKFSLHSELKSLSQKEEKAIVEMLLSKPFAHLMQLLVKELYNQENNTYKSLKKEVKRAVRTHLNTFVLLLEECKDGVNEGLYQSLYVAIDSLQTLLEDFYHVLGEKESQRLMDELNILLKPLREYRNCKEREGILKEIKSESDNVNLDIGPLLCQHEVELKEKIDFAIKLLETSTFHI